MKELLTILFPISLLDSTSMVPLSIAALTTILSGRRGLLSAGAFIGGLFVTYVALGILAVWGLDAVFQRISAEFTRMIKQPDTLDFALQIVIGVILIVIGHRMISIREKKKRDAPPNVTPWTAFTFAAGLIIIGMPGAVPYFAAVDQILRADLAVYQTVTAVVFYNVVFVLPLVVFVIVRLVLGEKADGVFSAVNRFMETWGRRLIVAALLLLGIVLVVDGVGWFLGKPLIPVGWPD